ncbi:hypothetical protein LINGRAHAP2_LOCUS11249 [Linum grandiflorum]
MSAEFDLAVVIGAPLKLSPSVLISSLAAAKTTVVSFPISSFFSAVLGLPRFCFPRYMLLCCSQQSSLLRSSPSSMRLRPKRTSSGVKFFGGFHINRSSHLFLFLRGGLT